MCDSQMAADTESCGDSLTATHTESRVDVHQTQTSKSSSELSGSTLQEKLSKATITDDSCQIKSAEVDKEKNLQGLTRCGELFSS
jgi:hypothetical protein